MIVVETELSNAYKVPNTVPGMIGAQEVLEEERRVKCVNSTWHTVVTKYMLATIMLIPTSGSFGNKSSVFYWRWFRDRLASQTCTR